MCSSVRCISFLVERFGKLGEAFMDGVFGDSFHSFAFIAEKYT